MKRFSDFFLPSGERIYTQEYIQHLRDEGNNKNIVAQLGGQENALASSAQIVIFGGKRGGSKSFSELMEALYDITDRNFRGMILRAEKPDLESLVEDSFNVYGQFGDYNRSLNDMTWNFYTGGKLRFSYYEGDYESFKKRFQGKQYAYVAIDEITHCEYKKFKYLLTILRNAFRLRSRFWGTCNPDPDSWVAKFIEWWLDEDGYPDPEKDGVVRYCYMPGNDVNEIVWGDSREEVFEKCRYDILKHWKPAYEQFGTPQELFIFSVAFIEGKLEDNVKLMQSNPTYLANLANQDEEQQSRDLDGNWKFRAAGDDLIKMEDMIAFYNNTMQISTTGQPKRYATADVALQGGDNYVMWLWEDWHIKDLFVCRIDSKSLVNVVKAKLTEWGVSEERFTYDFQGIGQLLEGFFPNAVKFINQAPPMAQVKSEVEGVKKLYKDLKSQCAYLICEKFRDRGLSIESRLLSMEFKTRATKGRLQDILMKERKCIRWTTESEGKARQIIPKRDMKKIVGHSPDFIESLLFRMIFELKNKQAARAIGTWCI